MFCVSKNNSAINKFATIKNVEYAFNFQSLILSQAQCSEKERACPRHVANNCKRQSVPIQQQADVEEKSWNIELCRVSGRSIVAQETNWALDKIRVGINKAYQDICDRDNYVIVGKVRNVFLGMP